MTAGVCVGCPGPVEALGGVYGPELSLGPSSPSSCFWVCNSFKDQNLVSFPSLGAPLEGRWVCGCLSGVVWRPGLLLDGRALITSVHPLQKLG